MNGVLSYFSKSSEIDFGYLDLVEDLIKSLMIELMNLEGLFDYLDWDCLTGLTGLTGLEIVTLSVDY